MMSSPGSRGARLPLAEALALGALHGPTELLPISSSAHAEIVPWLCSWRYAELDAELRKAFEVALHAATAAAMSISSRAQACEQLRDMSAGALALIVLACIPPAVAGYTLEREIERHLGTPPTIAAGLLGGALTMAIADRAPQLRGYRQGGPADGIWLGLAQASALIPGVSRSGATLTAARARRFKRLDASRLSRTVALPVIAGATLLKGLRLGRRSLPEGMALPYAGGAGAAFASTLACSRLIGRLQRDRPLWPYAAYRAALAGIVITKLAVGRPLTPATTARRSPEARV